MPPENQEKYGEVEREAEKLMKKIQDAEAEQKRTKGIYKKKVIWRGIVVGSLAALVTSAWLLLSPKNQDESGVIPPFNREAYESVIRKDVPADTVEKELPKKTPTLEVIAENVLPRGGTFPEHMKFMDDELWFFYKTKPSVTTHFKEMHMNDTPSVPIGDVCYDVKGNIYVLQNSIDFRLVKKGWDKKYLPHVDREYRGKYCYNLTKKSSTGSKQTIRKFEFSTGNYIFSDNVGSYNTPRWKIINKLGLGDSSVKWKNYIQKKSQQCINIFYSPEEHAVFVSLNSFSFEDGANHHIYKLSTNGDLLDKLPSDKRSSISPIDEFASKSSLDFFVVRYKNSIKRIYTSNLKSREVRFSGGYTNFRTISGVDIDAEGRIYVIDSEWHHLQIFDRDGRFIMKFGEYGAGPSQFDTPTQIAVSSQGYVFVQEKGNNRIQHLKFEIK